MRSGADMSRSRVYLDTWVLVGLVSRDSKRRSRSEWKILKKLTGGAIDVVVPQVVLGEAVAAVVKKGHIEDKAKAVGTILNILLNTPDRVPEMPSGDPEGPGAYGKPGVPETAGLTVKLCGKGFDLGFADALILAHVLADPYSTHLIADDARLQSNAVRELEKEMRENGERVRELSVADRFSHGRL